MEFLSCMRHLKMHIQAPVLPLAQVTSESVIMHFFTGDWWAAYAYLFSFISLTNRSYALLRVYMPHIPQNYEHGRADAWRYNYKNRDATEKLDSYVYLQLFLIQVSICVPESFPFHSKCVVFIRISPFVPSQTQCASWHKAFPFTAKRFLLLTHP
jgi:hypothetical protein